MHTVCSSDVLTQCSLAQAEYQDWINQGLKLNMARGKPGRQQLDLVSGLLTALTDPAECFDDGIDARNYGEIAGLSSARSLFAELLGCLPEQVFVGGNSSLTLMYDTIAKAMTHGLLHSERPWSQQKGLKWLCPAPGYDRHFKITESFGFELITVPMTPEGPDMDVVEHLIQDPYVKGMWNVPKYSNPDGIVYSAQTVQRLAAMKPAAPDFLLMWDNAYCVHEFEGEFLPFADIIGLCAQNGNPDMVFEYASTSKITIPGAGVACFACSQANMEYMLRLLDVQVISYDKVNQLRHVRYLKDKAHVLDLMKQHAEILKQRFDVVTSTLEKEIAPLGLATWNRPKGGYFVSVNTLPGLAKRTIELCREAGVIMTNAGATFPYGIDPKDQNIRIAPSYPSVSELQQAMDVFCCCLKCAAFEQMNQNS